MLSFQMKTGFMRTQTRTLCPDSMVEKDVYRISGQRTGHCVRISERQSKSMETGHDQTSLFANRHERKPQPCQEIPPVVGGMNPLQLLDTMDINADDWYP